MSPNTPSGKPRTVRCPECGTNVQWSPDQPFRPFCSERCKNIDLGAWSAEGYAIPIPEQDRSDELH